LDFVADRVSWFWLHDVRKTEQIEGFLLEGTWSGVDGDGGRGTSKENLRKPSNT